MWLPWSVKGSSSSNSNSPGEARALLVQAVIDRQRRRLRGAWIQRPGLSSRRRERSPGPAPAQEEPGAQARSARPLPSLPACAVLLRSPLLLQCCCSSPEAPAAALGRKEALVPDGAQLRGLNSSSPSPAAGKEERERSAHRLLLCPSLSPFLDIHTLSLTHTQPASTWWV